MKYVLRAQFLLFRQLPLLSQLVGKCVDSCTPAPAPAGVHPVTCTPSLSQLYTVQLVDCTHGSVHLYSGVQLYSIPLYASEGTSSRAGRSVTGSHFQPTLTSDPGRDMKIIAVVFVFTTFSLLHIFTF